jgi:hypothetical protein
VPIERLNSQVLKEIKHPELNREQRYNFLKDSVGYELERPAVENILRIIYEG